ncbi:DUF4262 domain-containing protein [Nocardia niigatensis]
MSGSECGCVTCHDYGDRADMHPADQRLVDNISEHGWGVLAIPDTDTTGPWAFTVGLWHTYRVPEVAIFGIPPQNVIAILNLIGGQVTASAQLHTGQWIDDVLPDHRMKLRPVAEPWRRPLFGTAMRYYRATPSWPVLQCMWPDRSHRFPATLVTRVSSTKNSRGWTSHRTSIPVAAGRPTVRSGWRGQRGSNAGAVDLWEQGIGNYGDTSRGGGDSELTQDRLEPSERSAALQRVSQQA